MDSALKNISIELPVTDMSFIKMLVRKMGWTLKSQEDVIHPMQTDASPSVPTADTRKQYSPRIRHLRSLHGQGITQQDIDKDERLAYLLQR